MHVGGRLLLEQLAAAVLGLGVANAAPTKTVRLDLSVSDTLLIAQVLGQVQCPTVAQLEVCQHAVALLKTIREQAAKQVR